MVRVEPNIKDYERSYKDFRWEVPVDFNFVWDVIDRQADDWKKLALISVAPDGNSFTEHTYLELSNLSKRFAKVALNLGIKKGDTVIVLLPRIPEFYIAMLGLFRIGAIAIPTPTLSTKKDLHYRVEQAGAIAVVTIPEYASKIEDIEGLLPTLRLKVLMDHDRRYWIPMTRLMEYEDDDLTRDEVPATTSSDPMLIFFTSGTEGHPKMVLHTHAYPIGHYSTAFMVQDIHDGDIIWGVADTGWAKTAYSKFFGQFMLGATVLQHDQRGRFEPMKVVKILQRFGVSVFCATPTIYRMLILVHDFKKVRFQHLRHSLSAGEPLNPEVIRIWKEVTGLDIYDFYGQSETTAIIGNCRAFPIKYGSMGRPTLGHIIKVLDDDLREVPVGDEGHIAIKCTPNPPPGLMKEYWKRPESNKDAFRDGWYITGDKAYVDDEGYFWFVGRADDVIKASGYRVSPFEVESVLIEHPAVAEAAVIGVPDEIRGTILKAFISLAPGHEPSEGLAKDIQDFVKRTTAPYKYPRKIEFMQELPKTSSGKIQRKLLRKIETLRAEGIETGDGEALKDLLKA